MTKTATAPKTEKIPKADKPAKAEKKVKEPAPPSMPKPKEATKPLTVGERMKKCRLEQERIDALEHKLDAAKENVKELNSQIQQSKTRLREDLLDIPQGTFGFKDGEDPAESKDK